jgi:hypothetical protein
MSTNESIEKGSNTLTAIIFVSVLLAVGLLAAVIVMNTLADVEVDTNGATYETITVANESGYVNQTGYTLATYGVTGRDQFTITAVINATSNATIGAGNYTLTTGVLRNATATNWPTAKVTYTYRHDISAETGASNGINSMKDDVVSMISNFFEMMPTIGTILAVVVLIAVIVLLVMYVSRMRNSGQSQEGFTG